MMRGQAEKCDGMVSRVGQKPNIQTLNCQLQRIDREDQLSQTGVDRYLNHGDCAEFKDIVWVPNGSGSPLTKALGGFHCIDQSCRIQKEPQLTTPFDQVLYFPVRHRLPPIWINDLNLTL